MAQKAQAVDERLACGVPLSFFKAFKRRFTSSEQTRVVTQDVREGTIEPANQDEDTPFIDCAPLRAHVRAVVGVVTKQPRSGVTKTSIVSKKEHPNATLH